MIHFHSVTDFEEQDTCRQLCDSNTREMMEGKGNRVGQLCDSNTTGLMGSCVTFLCHALTVSKTHPIVKLNTLGLGLHNEAVLIQSTSTYSTCIIQAHCKTNDCCLLLLLLLLFRLVLPTHFVLLPSSRKLTKTPKLKEWLSKCVTLFINTVFIFCVDTTYICCCVAG